MLAGRGGLRAQILTYGVILATDIISFPNICEICVICG